MVRLLAQIYSQVQLYMYNNEYATMLDYQVDNCLMVSSGFGGNCQPRKRSINEERKGYSLNGVNKIINKQHLDRY